MSLNSINQVTFVVTACVRCLTASDGKHTNIWLQTFVTVTICNISFFFFKFHSLWEKKKIMSLYILVSVLVF